MRYTGLVVFVSKICYLFEIKLQDSVMRGNITGAVQWRVKQLGSHIICRQGSSTAVK